MSEETVTEKKVAAVVLAAGKGVRMKTSCPKVLNKIMGMPMIKPLLHSIKKAGIDKVVIVGAEDNKDALAPVVAPYPVVVQDKQNGTADAVLAAKQDLIGWDGDILVLFGDTPLIQVETIEKMKEAKKTADIVLLAFEKTEPNCYGHIICSDAGVERIVEFKDSSLSERQIKTCFSGLMCIDGGKVWDWIAKISNNNASGEYYLTDIVKVAKSEGAKISMVTGHEKEFLGINTLQELAYATKVVQEHYRKKFMDNGVMLIDPETVYFSYDTEIGSNVVIEPCVFFGTGVKIGNDVVIHAFSHIEEATIADGASIGPFARLRPLADIGKNAHIGNFVEIKKSTIEEGAKVNHLTYIGDARVGKGANIGAGTITCNYDGFDKYHTDIGEGAFIGSNSALVAPVTIGDGAIVGAGSAIAKDVPADALALTRDSQVIKKGWAAKFRESKKKQ